MSARKPPPRLDDPDEWFGEYEWSAQGSGPRDVPRPAWQAPDDPRLRGGGAARRRRLGDVTLTVRTLLLGGAAAAGVLVLIGLAAAGVFSGSGSSARHTTTSGTAPRTATRPTTTTTPTVSTPARTALSPSATSKPGDTGEQVKRLQRALARLGYSPGAADGSYGPATVAAVKRFQTASSLTADGVLGPQTLRALRQAVQKHR